jgi:hypothetical protein
LSLGNVDNHPNYKGKWVTKKSKFKIELKIDSEILFKKNGKLLKNAKCDFLPEKYKYNSPFVIINANEGISPTPEYYDIKHYLYLTIGYKGQLRKFTDTNMSSGFYVVMKTKDDHHGTTEKFFYPITLYKINK